MGQYVVRYGITRIVGEFSSKGEDAIPRGTQVIVRSDRGVECGEVLCAASEQTRQHLGRTDESGRILQIATSDDLRKRDQVKQMERKDFAECLRFVAERKLQMELLDVERLFSI